MIAAADTCIEKFPRCIHTCRTFPACVCTPGSPGIQDVFGLWMSPQCRSQIQTSGIEDGVRYQCCQTTTGHSVPQIAHRTIIDAAPLDNRIDSQLGTRHYTFHNSMRVLHSSSALPPITLSAGVMEAISALNFRTDRVAVSVLTTICALLHVRHAYCLFSGFLVIPPTLYRTRSILHVIRCATQSTSCPGHVGNIRMDIGTP